MLESLSRHRKVCRNLVYQCLAYLCVTTLISLLQHRNISSACSMSQHWILLLRPGQFIKQASHVATLFIYPNQHFFFFQCRDIHYLVSQRSFSEALLLSQQAFPCCNNQFRERRSIVATKFLLSAYFICRDKSFFVVTNSSWCQHPAEKLCRNINFICLS